MAGTPQNVVEKGHVNRDAGSRKAAVIPDMGVAAAFRLFADKNTIFSMGLEFCR